MFREFNIFAARWSSRYVDNDIVNVDIVVRRAKYRLGIDKRRDKVVTTPPGLVADSDMENRVWLRLARASAAVLSCTLVVAFGGELLFGRKSPGGLLRFEGRRGDDVLVQALQQGALLRGPSIEGKSTGANGTNATNATNASAVPSFCTLQGTVQQMFPRKFVCSQADGAAAFATADCEMCGRSDRCHSPVAALQNLAAVNASVGGWDPVFVGLESSGGTNGGGGKASVTAEEFDRQSVTLELAGARAITALLWANQGDVLHDPAWIKVAVLSVRVCASRQMGGPGSEQSFIHTHCDMHIHIDIQAQYTNRYMH